MKNKIYIAIICAFSIVFAVSSGFLIKHYYDSARQAEMYDNLIEVVETEPEETKEPMNYSEEKTFIPEYQELYLQLHKFENLEVNIPVGYDEYLRKLYSHINGGDYMVLPPEEKRIKHDNEAYWL